MSEEQIIRTLAADWHAKQLAADKAKDALQLAVRRAVDAGAKEVDVAEWADVARCTVRRWRGEPS